MKWNSQLDFFLTSLPWYQIVYFVLEVIVILLQFLSILNIIIIMRSHDKIVKPCYRLLKLHSTGTYKLTYTITKVTNVEEISKNSLSRSSWQTANPGLKHVREVLHTVTVIQTHYRKLVIFHLITSSHTVTDVVLF